MRACIDDRTGKRNSNIGTGGMERLCCAFHSALPHARIHVAGKPFEFQGFMFVSPPAHTKIFRILGEKRLYGVEDVTRGAFFPFVRIRRDPWKDFNTLSMDSGLRSQLSRAYLGPTEHSPSSLVSSSSYSAYGLWCTVTYTCLPGFFPTKSSPRQHCKVYVSFRSNTLFRHCCLLDV